MKAETKAESVKKKTAAKKTVKTTPEVIVKEATDAVKVVEEKVSKLEKTSAPKHTAKKAAKEKVVIQYLGNEVVMDVLLEQAKAQFLANGGEEKALKNLELYLKPEENAVYYVVNGTPQGKLPLFL